MGEMRGIDIKIRGKLRDVGINKVTVFHKTYCVYVQFCGMGGSKPLMKMQMQQKQQKSSIKRNAFKVDAKIASARSYEGNLLNCRIFHRK